MEEKYYYDDDAAQRVINFIEKYITHVKGELAGKPFILEEWQKEQIIKPLFGMKNKKTGLRQYRTAYIEIPRKNGKSNLCAAIGLYLMFADNELGAEIYSAAGDRQQAGIVFDIAKQMIGNNPTLRKIAKVFRNSITLEKHGNSYKAISADAYTKHGFNSHGIIFDELHTQPNRELWDVLTTSTGSRTQPLVLSITTAGYDKNSICYEIHSYAKQLLEGVIEDETFLPLIYSADEDDDWTKETTWEKANPGFGSIIRNEYLENACQKASNIPAYENTFKRLHLNIWTTSESKWISDHKWNECNIFKIVEDDFLNEECFAGLDLASVQDITALVLVFENEGKVNVIPYFWIPEETAVERSKKAKVPYLTWIKQGYIETTPGNVTDYDYIRAKINELGGKFVIKSCAFDRWNSSQLVNNLMDDGCNMSPFGQGYASMSAPTKQLEKMVLSKEINHGGNPVLRWMCNNIQLQQDPAGNIKFNKSKSTEKIDGMIALVMALGEMMTDESTPSQYGDKDILVL